MLNGTPPEVSLVICTHNPRMDYLGRVLRALQRQTLSINRWELLLVDNASKEPLATRIDLSWHPQAQLIRENELGLTAARVRGISESSSALLVFCDDDNVFEPGYLEEALRISGGWPTLGAWGGQLFPEFETTPPEWTRQYWPLLAVGSFENDRWSNQYDPQATPCGAGLCVRRSVAERYRQALQGDPNRSQLDRRGASLMSGGDTDMALTACDMGLGTGLFASLQLRHLIPSNRVTLDYLLKMREAHTFSLKILDSFRSRQTYRTSRLRRAFDFVRAFLMPGVQGKFRRASLRGDLKAQRVLNAAATSTGAVEPARSGDNLLSVSAPADFSKQESR